MCDPLDYWRGNTEIIEALSVRLSPGDLASLGQVSLGWREALNEDHMWWELCKRTDPGSIELFGKVGQVKRKFKTRRGWCPRTGEGLRLMGMLMNTIGWQHAKVKSTKRNPPQKSVPKCHNAKGYTFKI